jgi:hypothetical protein
MIIKGGSWYKTTVIMTFILADHMRSDGGANLYIGVSVVELIVNPHH